MKKMLRNKKGFTLIELMVVILIVSILAAVAIPIMRGRIDAAKWSEGKAMAGTLASALRAYYAEKGSSVTTNPDLIELGFSSSDLDGTYFDSSNFSWSSSWDSSTNAPTFTITVNAPSGITTPQTVTLDQTGTWSES